MPFLRQLILLLSVTLWAQAAPKIATVDIAKVIKDYHVTETNREEFKVKEKAMEENVRTIKLKESRQKLEEAMKALQAPSLQLETQKAFLKTVKEARADYEEVFQQWNEWQAVKVKEMNKEFTTRSREILNTIATASQKVGQEKGFDWVIDLNGSTSSQMSPLVYARDTTDITEDVIKLLNKDAPAKVEEKPDEAPPATE